MAAQKKVGRREDVFSHPREFYAHHTGGEYTHPLLRAQKNARPKAVATRAKRDGSGYRPAHAAE